jgi:hypothetical protein
MPFDLQISHDAIAAVQKLGVPVAYLLFNVWLLVQERKRTDKAEERIQALQTQVLQLATAQTEASMKTAAALASVADREKKA